MALFPKSEVTTTVMLGEKQDWHMTLLEQQAFEAETCLIQSGDQSINFVGPRDTVRRMCEQIIALVGTEKEATT